VARLKLQAMWKKQKGKDSVTDRPAEVPAERADGRPSEAEARALNALLAAGRYAESAEVAEAMTRRYPRDGFAWRVLGGVLGQMGHIPQALEALQRAVEFSPDDVESHGNLGAALIMLGRAPEAERSLRRALQINSDLAAAHNNLGVVLRDTGRFQEAEASFRRALQLKPEDAGALYNLSVTLYRLGRLRESEASYRQLLQSRPDHMAAHIDLSVILKDLGRPEEVVEICRHALQINPDFAHAHINLGAALKDLGRLQEAEASCRRAVQIRPDLADAHYNLAGVLCELGRLEEACDTFRRALAIKPDLPDAYCILGGALRNLGRLTESEASLRQALQIKPDFAEGFNNLGSVLLDLGRLDEAQACYRQALQKKRDFADAHSNLLFCLNYSQRSAEECLEEARQYGRMVAAKVGQRFEAWRCASSPSRLRVGLVSGDLRQHPVGYFLETWLAHVDPGALELYAYATAPNEDGLTARIKPRFAAWRQLRGKNDEEAARLIHDDGVHVLIDLAGHTAHNRLPVFAWKPAPLQASWLGYFATTGVTEIDYVIADPWTLPLQEERYFTERVWRLPRTRLCFTVPDVALEVSDLPALANGYVTFGSFNNLTKVNDAVVALWSRVLGAVPGSCLVLKAGQLNEVPVRQEVARRFAAHGVAEDRLVLEGPAPRSEYLAGYGRIDIALDPFPYTGGTTSAEALWMGVPVLTLAGSRMVSRQGVGLLMNAGLPEWVAETPEDYMERAVRHAGDLRRLASLRAGLREQVLASPLFDGKAFARDFERELKAIWNGNAKG
jgi:protein O-GlcNAc transferase